MFPSPEAKEAVADADLVLSLDWIALQGVLPEVSRTAQTVVHVSVDHHVHNGWSMDHQALAAVDRHIPADPDTLVAGLCQALDAKPTDAGYVPRRGGRMDEDCNDAGPMEVSDIAQALRAAVSERDVSLLHLPLSWDGAFWPFCHPLDYIGSDGGGGIGGGPGIAVGAALALQGTGRLPVAICGDGDFLMGVTAIWTAVHYRIPLLMVVANNRSFYNDEVHQERVAQMRDRPVENKWIGQKMQDPEIDLAAMARGQGAEGVRPRPGPHGLGASSKRGDYCGRWWRSSCAGRADRAGLRARDGRRIDAGEVVAHPVGSCGVAAYGSLQTNSFTPVRLTVSKRGQGVMGAGADQIFTSNACLYSGLRFI